MVNEPWPAQLNKKVWEKRQYDPEKQKHKSLVLSIGQVVPHEGMLQPPRLESSTALILSLTNI